MIFLPTSISALFVLSFEPRSDERGFFARTYCQSAFQDHGFEFNFVQSSISFNPKRGTLRGLHFQQAPHEEVKIVQCLGGKIFDVVLDLRPESNSFKKWLGFELALDQPKALIIPKGCAHGFLTLTDNVLVQYHMNQAFFPEAQRGVRWNDSAFSIAWPTSPILISERDQGFDDWNQ